MENRAYYDSGKMRDGASAIRTKLQTYTSSKEAIDTIVDTLRTNWDDDNNTAYAQKYNTQAKISAENVGKLMNEFAQVLDIAADMWDELYKRTKLDIG